MEMFITNYDTNEHIELFESLEEARKYNYNGAIHKAEINELLIEKKINEFDGGEFIAYEDSSELIQSEPIWVE